MLICAPVPGVAGYAWAGTIVRVFFAKVAEGGQAQGFFLTAELFHLGDEGVGVKVDSVLKLRAWVGDFMLDLKPIENIAAGSLLAGRDFSEPPSGFLDK